MNLKKKKKGFTLIELMAVIAIIAILAAVLVPTVSGYINRSKKTAIINQVRTAVNAVESYNATATSDLDGNLVIADLADGTTTNGVFTAKEGATLAEAGLLEPSNVDKLHKLDIETAIEINKDQQAVDNIELNRDGTLAKYNGTAIQQNSNSSEEEDE